MTRVSLLSSPLLLGFEEIERLIDRAGKTANDGYPPYNIERITRSDTAAPADSRKNTPAGSDLLRISLAVAGFTRDQLEITVEDSQLVVRGRQADDKSRNFLYRGIATRQFQRTFVLADGIEVQAADLSNGLLSIDLVRIEPERLVRRIDISERGAGSKDFLRNDLLKDAASGGTEPRDPDTQHSTTVGRRSGS
jgi:HSP20 family molecular chaperone IbpA